MVLIFSLHNWFDSADHDLKSAWQGHPGTTVEKATKVLEALLDRVYPVHFLFLLLSAYIHSPGKFGIQQEILPTQSLDSPSCSTTGPHAQHSLLLINAQTRTEARSSIPNACQVLPRQNNDPPSLVQFDKTLGREAGAPLIADHVPQKQNTCTCPPEDLQVPFLASPRQSCQVLLLQILRVIYLGAVHFLFFFVVDG